MSSFQAGVPVSPFQTAVKHIQTKSYLDDQPAVPSRRPYCISQLAVQTQKKIIQIDSFPQPPD